MNRITRTAISGITVGAICVGLAAIPYLFNTHDDGFNKRLTLVWFLSLSLPGLVMSLIIGQMAKLIVERHAVILTWLAAVVLAVALPAPAIVFERWADGLVGFYIALAVAAGSAWGWITDQKANQEAHTRRWWTTGCRPESK
jgi:hypothetical protein